MSRAADVQFRHTAFDAPEARALVDAVQAEYVLRYGGPDETPVERAEFAPPQGLFMVGWQGETPVACGGVRIVAPAMAELKRMYVVPAARRRGIARRLLARLEIEAAALGATVLRLETGQRQPEAVAMYRAAGYLDTEPFGYYAGEELSVHLAKRLATADGRADGWSPASG